MPITPMRTMFLSLLACASATAHTATPPAKQVPKFIEPIMVSIPAGEFIMGDAKSPNTQPIHKVKLASFQLAKYEVTSAEFELFLLATGYERDGKCSLALPNRQFDLPYWPPQTPDADNLNTSAAFCVSWADANAYIDWLNTQTGKHYYLPSEAQWEYAARAGSRSRYFFGDDERKLCDYANVYHTSAHLQSPDMDLQQPGVACNDYASFAITVGSFAPNAFGLHDMIGNADEWVADCAADNYQGAATDGSPRENPQCKRHVLRGGSWTDAQDRVTTHYRHLVDDSPQRFVQSSFRLALSADEKAVVDDNFARNILRGQTEARTRRANNIALVKHTLAASKTWNTGELIIPPMVTIPAGEFLMGSDDSDRTKPVHKVRVPSFKLSPYEVTVKQFKQFVQTTGYVIANDLCWQWIDENSGPFKLGFYITQGNWLTPAYAPSDYHPVMCVSWDDANAYLKWLSQSTGKHYRLPTEAEWEYAARAGSTSKYGVGDDEKALCDYGNIWDASGMRAFVRDKKYQHKTMACDDGAEYTSVVGTYKPNAFGLYDMQGNISEWVQDCDPPDYVGAPTDGSAVTSDYCMMRSRRGSNYGPSDTQVTFRGHGGHSNRSSMGEGFRIVEEIRPQDACHSDKDACKQVVRKSTFEQELTRAQQAELKHRHKITTH